MGQLAAKVRAKFPGAYDDLDDAALEKQVLAKHPEYADLATPEKPADRGFLGSAIDLGKSALHGIANHPVEAGAIAGGMLAVPLTGGTSLLPAMAAAGLGGAGGAGLGLITKAARGDADTPNTSTGVLRTMGEQGALQGAMEGGGRLVSGMLAKGAGRLYQSVLKPTQAMRAEHPDLIATGLKNRVPVSAAGAEKAGELVGQSKDAADALVAARAAQPNPPTIDPTQAVAGITRAVTNVRDLPVARPQMKAIGDYGRQYLAEHPGPMTVTDAQRAVRATDRYFDPAYRATMDRGNPVTAGSTAAGMGINDETRALLRKAVPGLQEQNAQTRSLAGLKEAVERRAGQQGNLSAVGMRHLINAGVGGGVGALGGKERGVETWATMEALTNPAVASRLAFGTSAASRVPFAQLVRAALIARLTGETDTAGDPPR